MKPNNSQKIPIPIPHHASCSFLHYGSNRQTKEEDLRGNERFPEMSGGASTIFTGMISSLFRSAPRFSRLLKTVSKQGYFGSFHPWFLLWPSRPAFVRFYVHGEERDTQSIKPVFNKVVSHGPVDVSSGWAQDVMKSLYDLPSVADTLVIAPLLISGELTALVGLSGDRTAPFSVPILKDRARELIWILKQTYFYESALMERDALRVAFSELQDHQALVLADPSRGLLTGSPAGLSTAREIAFGHEAHCLKETTPIPLPQSLQEKIDHNPECFQVVIGKVTTVGKRILYPKTTLSLPIYQIEFLRDASVLGKPLLNLNLLSASELNIFGLIIQGKSNEEIAVLRGRALATVKTQVHSILEKLQRKDRVDLIVSYRNHLPTTLPKGVADKISKSTNVLSQVFDNASHRAVILTPSGVKSGF